MIIKVKAEGNNIIESNKERIRKIKLNQQMDAKVVDKLYSKTSYEDFKEYLIGEVVFENILDNEVVRVFNCIDKEQFKSWYISKSGTKGIANLLIQYKMYK